MDIKLEIAPEFYQEEIRCDYRVDTKLKKIWAVELDLLSEFDRVCKKYNLHYTAWVGTLLGAVRHKGFIPWDDDLDVAMIREEFEKLKEIAQNEFHEPYFFQTALSDKKFFCPYARLRNSSTCGVIYENYSPHYNNGIYIDIYVLDPAPNEDKQLYKQLLKRKLIAKCLRAYYADTARFHGPKKLAVVVVRSLDHLILKYETLVRMYDENIRKYEGISTEYATMTHQFSVIRRCAAEFDDLKDCIYQQFEMLTIPIPRNFDNILKRMYGNYMKFPPVEQRGAWHNDLVYFDPDISYFEYFERLKKVKK